MARARPTTILDGIAALPWPVDLGFAVTSWVVLLNIAPRLSSDNPLGNALLAQAPSAAPMVAAFFGVAAIVSAARGLYRRRLVSSAMSAGTFHDMPWADFERAVAELHRREGYLVNENGLGGADGGIDVIAERDGQRLLVQCKRWRRPCGVATVRELLGVVTLQPGSIGVLACPGGFTDAARQCARKGGIRLLDDAALTQRLDGDPATSAPLPTTTSARNTSAAVACSACGVPMVKRTAGRGPRAGRKFLGCSNFPRCRTTVDL